MIATWSAAMVDVPAVPCTATVAPFVTSLRAAFTTLVTLVLLSVLTVSDEPAGVVTVRVLPLTDLSVPEAIRPAGPHAAPAGAVVAALRALRAVAVGTLDEAGRAVPRPRRKAPAANSTAPAPNAPPSHGRRRAGDVPGSPGGG